ncbi:LuxR C-terminal-related transcriptional regulator [Streptomyces marispadix]|uniref:LuxR C-terminal-related transcriptional regulator n=1 Tax=Streptomyces marispadix TaxID=2922868 RepID=A0ABS9SWR6_9ACTN|nr:LuxR C-terminal-related transcriptional regulator [Streptomyces marispadix]MCH6160727.1 LuxR C-terminal-related transcriptional regulator [Streptomyces marispadix]
MQRIRVLVVDDHRIFAESLAAALAAEQDVEVAAAGSAQAALRCLERGAADGRRFDVLLVDADLSPPPGGAGAATGGGPGAHGHAGPANGANWPPSSVASRDGSPNGPPSAITSAPGSTGQGPPGAARPPGAPASGVQAASGVPTPVGGQQVGPRSASSGGRSQAPSDADPGGIPLVGRVRSDHPAVRTVVLAERDDPRQAASALQAGAGGWVAKDCSLSRLLQVIRGVLKDETHLPPALLTGVLKELTASRKHRTESERLVESLTPREREVLRCMVAGLGRKAVAERLYLSPHTVRTHMQNVLGKLGVHSTLAAVALARRAGVGPVDLEPSGAAR